MQETAQYFEKSLVSNVPSLTLFLSSLSKVSSHVHHPGIRHFLLAQRGNWILNFLNGWILFDVDT
jgi:hypothetical protein